MVQEVVPIPSSFCAMSKPIELQKDQIAIEVGAAVKNLSHNASLHSRENIAPSKSGIKHLGSPQ